MPQTLESPPAPGSPPPPRRRSWSWLRPVCAGTALVLAGAPVGAVVSGTAWWRDAAGVVALVVLVGAGVGRRRVPPVGVAAVQLAVLAGAVTALFSTSGVLGVLPGPAALGELAALIRDAGSQIRTGVAPVPATPAMVLLVTASFGLAAVAVHAVAVSARAPAAAGVLLLAVFAVPAALADDLLPAWMLAAAAAGFGLLLLSGAGAGWPARAPGAVIVTAVALVLALGVGAAAGGIGTAGRLGGTGAGAARGGEIGLSPFTALRGQLRQGTPTELFRVTGLPRPAYLRALTLNTYVRDVGWQPSRPGPGTALTGPLPAVDGPGDRARIEIDNVGFRDYWLPLFGEPLRIDGVAGDQWAYDPASGTAYSTRPRREDAWTQEALLPAPSAEALRAAGTGGVDPAFLATEGIDPRVAAIAADVTSRASTGFDRAVALTEWFTGPGSTFTYDLSTAPGNGDDAMVDFLTRGRRGYCEQFASSMAAMLRTVGVPARVAVGFTGGREAGDARSVGTTDAHAWVEAWFPGAGWTTFDPTPLTDGRAIVPPYVAEATGANGPDAPPTAASEQPDPATAAAEPDPATSDPAADPAAQPEPPVDGNPDPGSAWSAVAPVLLGLLVAAGVVGLGGAPSLVRARQRARRLAAAAAGGPGAADAAWTELLAASADHGAPSPATDTVRGAARRLADEHGLDDEARRALRTVAGIVEESWYGGVDAAPDALTGPVRAVLAAIAAGTPAGLRDRLLPRSVMDRIRRSGSTEGQEDVTPARTGAGTAPPSDR